MGLMERETSQVKGESQKREDQEKKTLGGRPDTEGDGQEELCLGGQGAGRGAVKGVQERKKTPEKKKKREIGGKEILRTREKKRESAGSKLEQSEQSSSRQRNPTTECRESLFSGKEGEGRKARRKKRNAGHCSGPKVQHSNP